MHQYPVSRDYTMSRRIGSGTYGIVSIDSSNKFAIKQSKESSLKPDMIKEAIILRSLGKAQNIIQMHSFYCMQDSGLWDMAIVMPVKYGHLHDFYKISAANANYSTIVIEIMQAVCIGLYNMHEHGFLNLDIKPENILVNSDGSEPCIIDFGISKYVGNITHYQKYADAVTIWYRPPELIDCKSYNHKADCWSIGCLLGELIYGKPLFPGDNEKEMVIEQTRRSYNAWKPIGDLKKYVSLLNQILEPDPELRESISWILGRLGKRVKPIVQTNLRHLKHQCRITKSRKWLDRSHVLNCLIDTMYHRDCSLDTITKTITWMDKYGSNDIRTWMAAVDIIQESPYTDPEDWLGPNTDKLDQFEAQIVSVADKIRFDPTIDNFTDGSPLAVGLSLIAMYNSEYVTIEAYRIGRAIMKLINGGESTGDPDRAMTLLLSTLEALGGCVVLDIVPDLKKFIV